MPSRKTKQKLMKRRICSIAKVIACASFLILTIIGVSSIVRAMSLETIANENGIPASWQTASLGNPSTITVPAAFWDQRQDDCNDSNRQFEWVICGFWTAGTVQGIVKDTLGSDGLPVPSFVTSSAAWKANRDVFTANVTGHDPVQTSDNFYRWFHETAVSKRYNREVTFNRTGKNTYTYGRDGVFPLDDVDFSKGDSAWKKGHNYHFTSHMSIPIKVSTSGNELFEFSGDDDVWVFLNNRLVIDLGGLHEKLSGWFRINTDGTVSTYVQNVNDTSVRDRLGNPSNDYNSYVNPLNELNRATFKDKYQTIDVGISEGDVVNLDFFYAERSTTESNTKVTITNMNWPISADSEIQGEVVGKIEGSDNKLVKFETSITNRDPSNPLQLERFAAYIQETTATGKNEGFIPLSDATLYYTATPDDQSSWKPLAISAPSAKANGFNLATPLTMTPAGTSGDTLYFRYFAETSNAAGEMTSTASYYTTLGGAAGVTYDYDKVTYEGDPVPATYNLTINYLYQEDNTPAAEPYTATLTSGENFAVDSPAIEGFAPDYAKVSGTISESDLTYNIYYSKVISPEPEPVDPGIPDEPTPIIPDTPAEPEIPDEPTVPAEPETPDEPTTPAAPELPILPSIPSSDLIDEELAYLAPLGEVAYVPNTGIISDTIATVFEVGFAEVILSQSFVMLILLIFAASFATWFSLRKYLNLNLATQSYVSHKHPKMPASRKVTPRAKSARNAHAMRNAKTMRRTKK